MATQTERQEIREKHPDSWVAVNPGDCIIGEVVDATEAWSDARTNNGKNPERGWYPLLTIGKIIEATGYPYDRDLKVHAFGAVLYNEVMRHRPDVGEKVHITYTGTGEAKKRGQSPPELYTLRVAGRTDQAKRAYDRIDRETERAGGSGSAPRSEPAQWGQSPPELPPARPDTEDIPF